MSKQSLNFEGFLNDLQNWEHSVKDKNNKELHKGKSKLGMLSEDKGAKSNATHLTKKMSQHQPPMDYDPLSRVSSSLVSDENVVDAASEKDLGNEYFKQKKFNEAIDCYSRSIALSPTAVAYANRAMAYLKIKRLHEAENDCTEALNLDDRYIKAYSRRATARKGLRKLRDSLEDIEFALRLEPENEELKKQRAEVKSLLEKAILAKAAGSTTRTVPGVKVDDEVDAMGHKKPVIGAPEGSMKAGIDVLPDNSQQSSLKKSQDAGQTVIKSNSSGDSNKQKANGLHEGSSLLKSNKSGKELGASVQELASRAASRARAEAAKNISSPNSAYQFEVSWKGFCGDRSLQAHLLKVTQPDKLPQIFKNALTAPLLLDIVQCIATFFNEETELAVKYLENLTKIPRFDMIIMCLPPADKAELRRTWDEVFLGNATPIEFAELLGELHPRFCPR